MSADADDALEGALFELDERVERTSDATVLFDPAAGRVVRLSTQGARLLDAALAGPLAGRDATRLARRLVRAQLAHVRPRPYDAKACRELFTVVIPVRDRPVALDRCLSALAGSAQVVVVDDASIDAGATAAVARRHGATLVRLEAARGPGGARNAGLVALRSELVAFLDSDCVPSPGWLEGLSGHFRDGEVAAVAPRVRPLVGGASLGARAAYDAARSPLDLGADPAEVRPSTRVSYVPSAALLVRRSCLDEGAFDPSLRYGEDVDLLYRLLDRGWRVRYEPSVVVGHEEPGTWSALLARRYRYGTSAGPLATRHGDALAPLVLRPLPSLAAAALLAGAPASAALLSLLAGARLAEALSPYGVTRRRALALGALGSLESLAAIGRFATMTGLPLLLGALGGPKRARRAALTLLVAPSALEYLRRRPRLDPLRYALFTIADDAAYGLGVLSGSVSARTLAALLPKVALAPGPLRASPERLRRSSRRRRRPTRR